jgi:hypothetical protein
MYIPLDFGFAMKPIPFLTWTLFSFRCRGGVLQVLRYNSATKPIQLQYTTIQYQITTNLDIFFECCFKNTDHLGDKNAGLGCAMGIPEGDLRVAEKVLRI